MVERKQLLPALIRNGNGGNELCKAGSISRAVRQKQAESTKAIQEGETGNDVAFEVEGIGEDRRGNADKVDPGIGTTRMGQRIFECVLSIGTRSAQSIMASGFTAAQTGRTHDRTRTMLQQLRKFLPRRRRMFSAGTNSDIQPSRKTTFIEVPDGPYGASPLSSA